MYQSKTGYRTTRNGQRPKIRKVEKIRRITATEPNSLICVQCCRRVSDKGQVRRSLHARRQASQGSRSRNSVNRRACIQDNNKLSRTSVKGYPPTSSGRK